MNVNNIYEILGISIYCSYNELMEAYIKYRKDLVQRTIQEKNAMEKAENQIEYRKHLLASNACENDMNSIDKLFRDNGLNDIRIGEEQKAIYDQSHKTSNAILGFAPLNKFEFITAEDKAKQLIEKYPEHEQEILQAADVIDKKEQEILSNAKDIKSNEPNNEEIAFQENESSEEASSEVVEENKPAKAKLGFKNWVKKIFAPALAVIGITVTVPKLLPEGEKKQPAQHPNPIEEVTPEAFRDKIKVQGVIYDDNGMQIIADESIKQSIFNSQNTNSMPQQEVNAKTDALSGFKAKMQNDSKLTEIVEQSLSDIEINGKHDASPYEKLDYIMSLIENKDRDCVMSYTQKHGGIKEYILNCINNTTLYYIEKQTGEHDITIRNEKEGFSLISNGGSRYVATTYKDIAKTNDSYKGTNRTLTTLAQRTLNGTKGLKDTYIKDYYTNIDSTIEQLGSLITNLNIIGDSPIIIDRDSKGMEI